MTNTDQMTVTIYVITYLYRRDYGDPCVQMSTDLHKAQAFALKMLQDFRIDNDDFIECNCNYDLESIWQLDNWLIFTCDRCEDVYIEFQTRILTLPTE
jgi:hypothetical protein